jgi:amidase
MPYFKQETLLSSNAKKDLKASEYQNSLEKSFEGSKKILNEVMAQYSLDAICGITMGPSCSIDTIYGDRWGTYSLTSPAAMSGYPHITVPCGQVYELPVGLSFFGKPYTEGLLISLGYAYEQATKKRAVPQYKVSFLS